MAIKMRRGAYGDFNPDKMLPGEIAVVLSGDSSAVDGRTFYICFEPGKVKRLMTFEDLKREIDGVTADIVAQVTVWASRAEAAANKVDSAQDVINLLEQKTNAGTNAVSSLTASITSAEQTIANLQIEGVSAALGGGVPVSKKAQSLTLSMEKDRLQSITSYGFERQLGTGEPSPTNVRPIVTGGNCANLLPITASALTQNGVTFTPQADGGIKIVGTATADTYYHLSGTKTYDLNNKVVTISGAGAASVFLRLVHYMGSAAGRSLLINGSGLIKTDPGGTVRCDIRVASGTVLNATIYPMLNYGDTAQPFVPYQAGVDYATRVTMNGVTKLIPLREPLCAGDTFETSVSVGGATKSRERHVRRKVVVTSISELFNSTSQRFANVSFDCFPTPMGQVSNALCDRLPIKAHTDGLANGNCVVAGLVNATDARLRIYFPRDGSINSTADANAFLAANPVTIVYDLATPVEYLADPISTPNPAGNISISGESDIQVSFVPITYAEKLKTALKIGNADFDGSKAITLADMGAVVAVSGKGLSTNDYTTADKTALGNKVDKVTGKGLSTNDFTNADKTALAGKLDKTALLDLTYPVGAIYTSINNTNPSSLFGGTWAAYAQGQMLVGVNPADTDFNPAGKTGGEKTHQLTISEMPQHSHTVIDLDSGKILGTAGGVSPTTSLSAGTYTNGRGSTFGTQNQGAGQAHNNMPPYITVYMWRRTA